MKKETGRRIVVGIDSSGASLAALEWALDEAQRRQADLEVVHAWTFPGIAVGSYGGAALPLLAREDLEKAAEQLVRDRVRDIAGKNEAVKVTTAVEAGHPAEVLLAAAKGADMLVVGSRGHGGFVGMLLGSVSSHVVHHSTCPVVVVPAG